jgi:hypothetical protein
MGFRLWRGTDCGCNPVTLNQGMRSFARRLTMLAGVLLATSAIVAACSSDSNSETPPATDQDASEEPQPEAEAGGDTTAEPEGEAGPEPTLDCEDLGLEVRPFEDADGSGLRQTAADFTLPTTGGDWNLKQQWSGCDIYLLIQDKPKQNTGSFGYGIWDVPEDMDLLLTRIPKNVHFFFASTSSDEAARSQALADLKAVVDGSLAALAAEDQTWWGRRVHYVTARASTLPGWVGKLMGSPGWGVGIDRSQRIRFIGSYADPAKLDQTQSWPFGPNVSMVANEAILYNAEAKREDRLAAENATVVEVCKATAANAAPYMDVELPDAATMAGFDTLEFDLSLTCGGKAEFGTCPAWDYDAYLHLCEEATPAPEPEPDAGPPEPACPYELGHWITSYHREGRWVHDVSGILPLLAKGGKQKLRFTITDPWVVDLSLRFYSQNKSPKPSETIPLFAGQYTFDENYNANYQPMTIAIPADAQKVEIASVITEHGMSSPGTCAEFCNTDHHFLVNGKDNKRDFPMAGNQLGCQDQIENGTVPNQYGTWWYGRDGWCPGKQVDMAMTDITSQVTKGADNTFEYQGFWKGKPYLNGSDWRHIHLTSWLLISR